MDDEQKPKEFLEESAQIKQNLKGWLTSVLRRASFRWGGRSTALKRSRRARGEYECAMCHGIFKSTQIVLDHIVPVVPVVEGFPFRPNGKPDWNIFIDRLFCEAEGFQVLCDAGCHSAKTAIEDKLRAEFAKQRRDAIKEEKKKQKDLLKSKKRV